MISTNQFKNGMTIKINGEVYSIIQFQHVKPGKGGAFVRTKVKNLKSGAVLDRTFRAGQKFETAYIEPRKLQFLYRSGAEFCFMDQRTYEQIMLDQEHIREHQFYLKDNDEVIGVFLESRLVDIELPAAVTLKITEAEPGARGDTVKSGTKPAVTETGLKIKVPLFVNPGDRIKIDTRSGQYLSRA
jgi:elongation factor P